MDRLVEDRLIEWKDLTDRFEVSEENLVYIDGPFEGFLKEKPTGALFAFRCVPVIPDLVWLWVLIDVTTFGDVGEVFDEAKASRRAWVERVGRSTFR